MNRRTFLRGALMAVAVRPAGTRPTFRYPSQYASLRAIADAMPPKGAIIEVEPGRYDDAHTFKTNGRVDIYGLRGSRGERPFFGHLGLDAPGAGGRYERYGSGELALFDLEIAPYRGVDAVGFVRGRRLSLTRCYLHHGRNGLMVSHIDGPATVELRESEFAFCGNGGNGAHNVYVSRVDHLLVEDSVSHSARGGHAIKHIARRATIRRNRLATYLDAAAGYSGTTLYDAVACGTSVVSENVFERWAFRGNKYMTDIRRRNSINGADTPFGPYFYGPGGVPTGVRDERFYDPEFWAMVAAAGLHVSSNPHLFHHYVYDNLFINHGVPGEPAGVGLRNEGTAPVEFTRGSKRDTYLPLPEGWVERAVIWTANNRWEGDPVDVRYDDRLAPIIDLGDEGPLPAWFPAEP